MKVLAVFMLLAIATQLTHAANVNFKDDLVSSFVTRGVEEKIKAFLDKLKEMMKTGDEAKGIPQMDPLEWDHQEISLDDELLTAQGEVDEVYVQGLSNFNVEHADFKFTNKIFSIALAWPIIEGDTRFNIIDAKIMDFIPVFGKGNATFKVENLKFSTNAKIHLDLANKKVQLKNFNNTTISLDKLKLDAKGLYENDEFSEFISAVISDTAPQGLIDFQKEIVTRMDNMMLEKGNEMLTHLNFDDILGIIMP